MGCVVGQDCRKGDGDDADERAQEGGGDYDAVGWQLLMLLAFRSRWGDMTSLLTLGTNNATATMAFRTNIAAAVPTRACSSRMSKWAGHMGRSQAFFDCSLLKTFKLLPPVPMMARQRHMDKPARPRVGVLIRDAMVNFEGVLDENDRSICLNEKPQSTSPHCYSSLATEQEQSWQNASRWHNPSMVAW